MTKMPTRLLRSAAAAVALVAAAAQSQATTVRLEAAATVSLGSTFEVSIMADIDPTDEIIGFGFDLVADSAFRFLGFTAGPGFADDPTYLAPFSDSDGIRAASGGSLLFGAPVSGTGLLLGRLLIEATALGSFDFGLSADDLGFNFTEGLIPLSIDQTNFMPAVTPLAVQVIEGGGTVSLPGTLPSALLALLLCAAVHGRRPGARPWPSAFTSP